MKALILISDYVAACCGTCQHNKFLRCSIDDHLVEIFAICATSYQKREG